MKNLKLFMVAFLGCIAATVVIAGVGLGVYLLTNTNTETENEVMEVTGTDIVNTEGMITEEELELRLREAKMQQEEQTRSDVLTSLKNALLGGKTTVETIRSFYPQEIVLVSGGKYHFVPINQELKMHSYEDEKLTFNDKGFAQYLDDGTVTSYIGVDVSKFQGKIDWEKVAADGVDFAILRVGYRGYGEAGTLNVDATFDDNAKGALKAGLHVGVYFYTQALNEEELQEEVDLILENIAPYAIDCPIVFDVEKVNGNGRMNELSVEERTNLTILFCEKIKAAGYVPMIYLNMEMGALMLDLTKLEDYEKWFAYYNTNFYYPYNFTLWQYDDGGNVNGIKGDVDMNIAFEPIWKE